MAKMYTTRGYWVDWICVFDQQPSASEIKRKEKFLLDYIKNYLSKQAQKKGANDFEIWDNARLEWIPISESLIQQILGKKGGGKTIKGTSGFPDIEPEQQEKIIDHIKKGPINWIKILKWEMTQVCSRQMIFNFKAYFEDDALRYTADTKGSMTPPPPPPPAGN